MPAQMQYQPDGIHVLRISGVLKRSEFGSEQNAIAGKIDAGSLQASGIKYFALVARQHASFRKRAPYRRLRVLSVLHRQSACC
jgi:hypothetical protein